MLALTFSIILSVILYFFIICTARREEGFITIGHLLLFSVTFVPVLNIAILFVYLNHTGVLDKPFFVKKKSK